MNKQQLTQRQQRYLNLITHTAHTVGVSKRTGKVWRNDRTRTTGRHESPSINQYRSHTPHCLS